MRHTARALVGVVLVACGSQYVAAAESGSRWWPFGHHDEAKIAQPPAVAAPAPAAAQTPSPSGAAAPSGSVAPAPLAQQAQLPNSSAEPATKERWMFKSRKGKVGWPHLAKPKAPETGLFAQKTTPDATRNSWVEKTPAPPKPSPLKPITDGAHKVSKSTKAAWHKTVDALTPDQATPPVHSGSSRIAKREVQSPFWKRMFGAEPELQQPQTIPEWMAQRRVEP